MSTYRSRGRWGKEVMGEREVKWGNLGGVGNKWIPNLSATGVNSSSVSEEEGCYRPSDARVSIPSCAV